VRLITDACATYDKERHDFTLRATRGYCRQRTTAEFLRRLAWVNGWSESFRIE